MARYGKTADTFMNVLCLVARSDWVEDKRRALRLLQPCPIQVFISTAHDARPRVRLTTHEGSSFYKATCRARIAEPDPLNLEPLGQMPGLEIQSRSWSSPSITTAGALHTTMAEPVQRPDVLGT